MATLQNIRSKAGVLVSIIIGLSLAAFVLGDFLQNGNTLFQRNRLQLANIDGKTIQYTDFQSEVDQLTEIYKSNSQQKQLDENTMEQIREQTWQTTVEKNLMEDVYQKLGIKVSSEELFDMIQGNNLHPFIQNTFRNPNTGQIDKNQIIGFLKNLETPNVTEEQRNYWLYMEKQIVEDRIRTKYLNMINKGLYATSQEVQNNLEYKNNMANIEFIALNLSSVSDSQVVVTDKDLKAYYESHKETLKQPNQRKIEYVTFPVVPSATDFQMGEKWINDIKNDFISSTENVQFISTSSDESFDPTWYKKETLPSNLAQWVFDGNAEINASFGPYFENNTYKISKLNAIEMQPDSVQARHILLEVKTQEEVATKQALADSLKKVIENGGDFATLALLYSTDQGSKIQGGNLGWFGRGQMVKPFEDAAFANKKNEVKVVASQFGIHIVQTTDRGVESKKVQIATLARKVIASSQTSSDIYTQASKFASKVKTKAQFDAEVSGQKLEKKLATVTEMERQIAGLENGRILVRAAFEADKGKLITGQDESPIFELGENFVVAVLTDITEEGISTFENSKTMVELNVIKEKKLDYLVKKLNNVSEGKTDLYSVASSLGTSVQTANDINFNSFQIPGLGIEPAVIGTVSSLEVNKISKPIAGTNGAYIVKVVSVNKGTDKDLAAERLRLAQANNYRANGQAMEARKKTVEIVDKRAKFY